MSARLAVMRKVSNDAVLQLLGEERLNVGEVGRNLPGAVVLGDAEALGNALFHQRPVHVLGQAKRDEQVAQPDAGDSGVHRGAPEVVRKLPDEHGPVLALESRFVETYNDVSVHADIVTETKRRVRTRS